MIFVFHSINMAYYIYWFAYAEQYLHLRNKSSLIMVYDYFNMMLNSIGKYILENFCIYIHKGVWPGILSLGLVV